MRRRGLIINPTDFPEGAGKYDDQLIIANSKVLLHRHTVRNKLVLCPVAAFIQCEKEGRLTCLLQNVVAILRHSTEQKGTRLRVRCGAHEGHRSEGIQAVEDQVHILGSDLRLTSGELGFESPRHLSNPYTVPYR